MDKQTFVLKILEDTTEFVISRIAITLSFTTDSDELGNFVQF